MSKTETTPSKQEVPSDQNRDVPLLLVLEQLCKFHGLRYSKQQALSGVPNSDNTLPIELFAQCGENLGLKTLIKSERASELSPLVYPAIVLFKDGSAALVHGYGKKRKSFLVELPGHGLKELTKKQLDRDCVGTSIIATVADQGSKTFGVSEQEDSHNHWLWSSVLKAWPSWVYMVITAVVVNLLGLALPLFVMNVYDRVIPYNSISTLWALVTGVSIALFLDFVLRLMRSALISNASQRVDMTVSSRLFRNAMDTKLSQRNQSAGELANQVREFESIKDFFTSTGLLAIVDLIFIGVFLTALWFIVSKLALVPLIAVPIVLIITLIIQWPLARAVKKSQSAQSSRHSVLVESLTGIETVKAISAEGVMQKRWEDAVARNVRAGASIGIWSSAAIFFSAFIQQAVSVVLITWGVFLIAEGEITIGALIASNILAGRVLAPLGGIATTLVRLQQSFGAFGHLNRFMKLDGDHKTAPDSSATISQGRIEIRDVGFAYPGNQHEVLQDISLRIAPGERVAILGRVGSGKSSLGKLLCGLYETTKGAIIVDDSDTRHYSIADLRNTIGYVSQEPELFTGTLRDNILMASGDAERLEESVRVSGCLSIAQSHPLGFDMPVGERGKALSGGQRQSVALARVLACDHKILFLDEPTSQMDTRSEAAFLAAFRDWIQPDTTLILSTHRASLLDLVNRVVILEKGKIIADGPKEAVLQKFAPSMVNSPSNPRKPKVSVQTKTPSKPRSRGQ